jgi:hypothetical protein
MAKTERCYACSGSGRQGCTTCGGKGGRYKLTLGYDSDGRPVDRERWESCYHCGGQGREPCWRCRGSGEIRSYGNNTKPTKAPAPDLPKSPRDLRDEFDLTKRDVLARLIDCDLETREVRREIIAIDIDTPDAYQKLTAIEEILAKHPDYGKLNPLLSIRWDINTLARRADEYEYRVKHRDS